MKIFISEVEMWRYFSIFHIKGIPFDKENDFQHFLCSKLAPLCVQYKYNGRYCQIDYPTTLFGLIYQKNYHEVYTNWILEWIEKNK